MTSSKIKDLLKIHLGYTAVTHKPLILYCLLSWEQSKLVEGFHHLFAEQKIVLWCLDKTRGGSSELMRRPNNGDSSESESLTLDIELLAKLCFKSFKPIRNTFF